MKAIPIHSMDGEKEVYALTPEHYKGYKITFRKNDGPGRKYITATIFAGSKQLKWLWALQSQFGKQDMLERAKQFIDNRDKTVQKTWSENYFEKKSSTPLYCTKCGGTYPASYKRFADGKKRCKYCGRILVLNE
jgi:hypothetical protein